MNAPASPRFAWRAVTRGVVIVAIALAAVGVGTLVIGRTAPVSDEQAAKAAQRAFLANLAKGDQKAVAASLDRRFTWIDAEGRSLPRRETLKALPALAAANQGEAEVETHFYGRLLSVRGNHDGTRFLRVFVKRRHGWRAFVLMDTPVSPAGAAASFEHATAGDCENPCRTVPYTPRTPVEKEVLAAWQQLETLQWRPDAAQWANGVADEFVAISETSRRNKEERVATLKRQQDAGTGTAGDPVTSMRIYGFGTQSAVMISQQVPYSGGKPYSDVRVWTLRDGRWQLALSQQVTIQAAPAGPAVASKQ
jgi:hypothetical protein